MKEIIDDPDSSKMFMILEYCEKGEIEWRDRESSPALTVDETRRIFRDTLLGLEYRESKYRIRRSDARQSIIKASFIETSSRPIFCDPAMGQSKSPISVVHITPRLCVPLRLKLVTMRTDSLTMSSWPRQQDHRLSSPPRCVSPVQKVKHHLLCEVQTMLNLRRHPMWTESFLHRKC